MIRRRGRSRVYASALMPITVRGRVAVATRTRIRRSARIGGRLAGRPQCSRMGNLSRRSIRRPFYCNSCGKAWLARDAPPGCGLFHAQCCGSPALVITTVRQSVIFLFPEVSGPQNRIALRVSGQFATSSSVIIHARLPIAEASAASAYRRAVRGIRDLQLARAETRRARRALYQAEGGADQLLGLLLVAGTGTDVQPAHRRGLGVQRGSMPARSVVFRWFHGNLDWCASCLSLRPGGYFRGLSCLGSPELASPTAVLAFAGVVGLVAPCLHGRYRRGTEALPGGDLLVMAISAPTRSALLSLAMVIGV